MFHASVLLLSPFFVLSSAKFHSVELLSIRVREGGNLTKLLVSYLV